MSDPAKYTRIVFFWVITQRVVGIPYRSLGEKPTGPTSVITQKSVVLILIHVLVMYRFSQVRYPASYHVPFEMP